MTCMKDESIGYNITLAFSEHYLLLCIVELNKKEVWI
jgi:hypothetical protein